MLIIFYLIRGDKIYYIFYKYKKDKKSRNKLKKEGSILWIKIESNKDKIIFIMQYESGKGRRERCWGKVYWKYFFFSLIEKPKVEENGLITVTFWLVNPMHAIGYSLSFSHNDLLLIYRLILSHFNLNNLIVYLYYLFE